MIVTKVNKPTAYKSKGITINVWKASAGKSISKIAEKLEST